MPATLLVTMALLITGSLLAWGQYTRDVLAEREHAGNMQRMAERRADEALRNYRRARVAVDAAVSSMLGDDEPGTSELASGQREVLEHARVVYADLTRENPSDPELQYEQAIAHLKLGQVLRRTATRREAAAEFERAISLFAEVRDAIDGPQESDRRKAEAMLFLAMDARETGNADSGVVLATQALRIVPSAGADDLLRARILATLAWAQSDSGNQSSAIKSYHQAINLLQKLNQREPQSVAALSVLGESAFRLAACYTRTADAVASQKFRAMATEARREAVRLSPDSPYPKSSLLISLAGDALVCVRNRRFEDALSILAEAGALGEQITVAAPHVGRYHFHSAGVHRLLAIVHGRKDAREKACSAIDQALILARRACEISPDSFEYREMLRDVLKTNASMLRGDRKFPETIAMFQELAEQRRLLLQQQPHNLELFREYLNGCLFLSGFCIDHGDLQTASRMLSDVEEVYEIESTENSAFDLFTDERAFITNIAMWRCIPIRLRLGEYRRAIDDVSLALHGLLSFSQSELE